ncbi:ribonucleoside-diphosphate reductase subunit beta [Chlorogloeopsis fritschii PCC 6912]|uniref:Ribonucleoside-diphosphate reductase subunit beta n=1 Tax=Chlorogloeopsis fritschii PCC 6912 TaxID=211165 RepID=A0A433N1W5_CHLFR|nr:ribonucleotide-diphosphate reductase subunit beta [Chlorogloeopsis fritschii]RUR74899.1 ribonucleoside-diphosphate reductase subunit beta [Chlorogloeopsis fritschii PCC 6912]
MRALTNNKEEGRGKKEEGRNKSYPSSSFLLTPPLFNPEGDDSIEHREIWGGNSTGLMNLNNCKFQWAIALYRQMLENFWIPEKVDLSQDANDYKVLTDDEKQAYKGILSYLTFLDSIQARNLPNLSKQITAPEITLCFAVQEFQEVLHNHSYQYILESVIPANERQGVYDFWRSDEILRKRCEFIASIYQDYIDDPTTTKYMRSLLADYLLEGLYFYNGFIFFYVLASRHLCQGTSDVIRYINRDEMTHVNLIQKLLTNAGISSEMLSVDEIQAMFAAAVEYEIKWTNHIIGNRVLGITEASTEEYTKYLANLRLKAIGVPALFEDVRNPYQHLERLADTGAEGNVRADFFEVTVTSYNQSTSLDGDWNF